MYYVTNVKLQHSNILELNTQIINGYFEILHMIKNNFWLMVALLLFRKLNYHNGRTTEIFSLSGI